MIVLAKLWPLLVLCLVSAGEHNFSQDPTKLIHLTSRSIDRTLSFLDSVKGYLTVDGLLGTVIVREQSATALRMLLSRVQQHRIGKLASSVHFIREDLERLIWKASQVTAVLPHIRSQDPAYFEAIGGILHPAIWSQMDCHPKQFNQSFYHRQASVHTIPINESISDQCLSEVLHGCKISNHCWSLFTEHQLEGYPLTHQVLYLTIAQAMKCFANEPPSALAAIEHKIATLCESMLEANVKLEIEGYPQESQDLFMQNIVVCGQKGFAPFRNRYHWLLEIIGWQNRDRSCFAVDRHKLALLVADGLQSPAKRRERVFQDGCSLHKTSMALAAMSIYLQQLIIEWLNLCAPTVPMEILN